MNEREPMAKAKLTGGPEQTVSAVFVTDDGAVHFDFFDFSPMAQEHFGNDIAITIHVTPVARGALLHALSLAPDAPADVIVATCAARFQNYFDVQPFLDRHDIPFDKTFDSRA